MLKLYIADDEEIVRTGLKKIIDWHSLDFELCGESGNGLTAYNEIKELAPDLIMIDIRMPKLQGLDLASQLREDGYRGHIIVLSGYSEFKYAQEAIKCDVDYYLTKPIEEQELFDAVCDVKNIIQKHRVDTEHLNYYQEKAKSKILEDIINGDGKNALKVPYSLEELNLKADQYQVLILQSLKENFDTYQDLCNSLKIPYNTNMVEQLRIAKYQVILLKGEMAISRFYSYKEKTSEIVSKPYFIAVGSVVSNINDIYHSFHIALDVYEHQFFFEQDKYIAEKSGLPNLTDFTTLFTAQNSKELGKQLYDFIVIFKKTECETFIDDLKERLINSKNSAESIKGVLAGMYIYVVQEFKKDYANYNPEFMTNAAIIHRFHSCSYLQEILDFMKEETQRLIQIIGGYNSDSIVDEIVEFIKYHFIEDIKLKSLAPKFGYNSSYLGKIFSKKVGIGFNDYLHKVRTTKAKELLLNNKYKVYEISSLVGYKNVDYFHLKFKQFEGCTPNEYRIEHHIDIE